MSEFLGSKGKWKYEVKYGKNKPRITVQIPGNEYGNQELILGTISEDDCAVETCCCTEEHANALLISKAPIMLAELIECKKRFEALRNMGLENDAVEILEKLIDSATNLGKL